MDSHLAIPGLEFGRDFQKQRRTETEYEVTFVCEVNA